MTHAFPTRRSADLAEEGVRTALVIAPSPRVDLAPGVSQRQEPMGVQAFIPEAPVEGFHKGVVRWLPGRLKSNVTPFSQAHRSSAFEMNSGLLRSEEHTSELQSLMRTSYAVFCL